MSDRIKCPFCDKDYANEDTLGRHIVSKHPEHAENSDYIGLHAHIDLFDIRCTRSRVSVNMVVHNAMLAADKIGLFVIDSATYNYGATPQDGISVLLLLLRESHISIHTHPEMDYVGIDLFSCAKRTEEELQPAIEILVNYWKAKRVSIQFFKRGLI